MRRAISIMVLVSLVLATGGFTAACGPPQPWEEEIELAVPIPLTKELASYGQDIRFSMEYARKEINDAGGINGKMLRIEYIDCTYDVARAVSVMRGFISKPYLVVFSSLFSTENASTLPLANEAKVPCLAQGISRTEIVWENRPWTFGTLASAESLHRGPVQTFMKLNPQVKKVVTIYDKAEPCATTEAESTLSILKEMGVKTLGKVHFTKEDREFSSQVTKAKSFNPDCYVIGGVGGPQGGLVTAEIRRQVPDAIIFCTLTAAAGTPFLEAAGEASDGVYTPDITWKGNPDPHFQELRKAYEVEFPDREVAYWHTNAYDSIIMVAMALKEAKVTNNPAKVEEERERVRDAMSKLKDVPGLMTTFDMGPRGVAVYSAFLFQFEEQTKVIRR